MAPVRSWLPFAGIALIALTGSMLDPMEVDAAQYAGMARDMLQQEDWTRLYFRGHDYLDKPPLLFWLSALSFKAFGVSNWSYKLPSILFALLGLYSTYRFALLHHGRETALRAAILLGTSAAFLLMTNDVRCDTILTGAVITAIWLGSAWMEQRRSWQLIGASLAIGAGMLAKGPIGLMAPLLALGSDLAWRRRWSLLRDPRLLVAPALIALLLLPMCLGLHAQHGAQGLRFYFWEQSFGRITGENRWKDDSTVLFFTHEVLWQLLPWTLFVLAGLWRSLAAIALRASVKEAASIGGVLLVFVALSLSRFKLPHYLYVIVPLLAVIGAQAWPAVALRGVRLGQVALLVLLAAVALLLCAWCFPQPAALPVAFLFGLVAWWALRRWRRAREEALFDAVWQTWVVAALALNLLVYPEVLRYQANAQAGRWAAAKGLAPDAFYGMQVAGTAMDFYAGYPVRWLSDADEARAVIRPGVGIYTDRERYQELLRAGLRPAAVDSLPHYSVQLLGADFLLPGSRAAAVEQRYLLTY
jgi:4-amino-4-deoxy-L-arabinose transferase-like glycosyltransferase